MHNEMSNFYKNCSTRSAFFGLAGKIRLTSLAEREGFEPSIHLRVYKLSRLALSTTQTPLQWVGKLREFFQLMV